MSIALNEIQIISSLSNLYFNNEHTGSMWKLVKKQKTTVDLSAPCQYPLAIFRKYWLKFYFKTPRYVTCRYCTKTNKGHFAFEKSRLNKQLTFLRHLNESI